MSIKFLVLGGGILGFLLGGGECRFYFYGRADFSENSVADVFSNDITQLILKRFCGAILILPRWQINS